jgi:hypothetical protein
MTLNEKITSLKKLYPTLSKGINDEIIELTEEEYEATIQQWAQFEVDQAKTIADLTENKKLILEKLNLTQDEIKILLA